ncbi:MAG: Gfo/Idh/MocA family oxidoreductase [Bacteroidota bacterium]|nr:Gfo/Idh/MocA family oxidoreductase [Bacteroidota bacterium]
MNPFSSGTSIPSIQNKKPIKLGIAGLSHDHVRWIFDREGKSDIEIVGIWESNAMLATKYRNDYKLDGIPFYTKLQEMLDKSKPEAVCAFTSIAGHLEVVEQCAVRGIHVMVEKPLHFSLEHAQIMARLAKQNKIHLLTNFQTSWYASTHYANFLAFQSEILGDVWKVVFHDGHKGPKEKGCSKEFLNWLTDPKENGAGAIVDFGCYGPNIMTWMMKGEMPLSVLAIKQTIKPEIYSQVDDEAVILLEYPKAQAVIQASWNWPINRKDIEIYGKRGQLIVEDHQNVRIRKSEDASEEIVICPQMEAPLDDPFSYFAAVVEGIIQPGEYDLSSINLNVAVVAILEAAIQSANTGKKIYL